MYATINDKVYALDEIPKHERVSKNFDLLPSSTEPKKKYIPPMTHPWKQNAFSSFVKKQKHHFDLSFEEVAYTQAILY